MVHLTLLLYIHKYHVCIYSSSLHTEYTRVKCAFISTFQWKTNTYTLGKAKRAQWKYERRRWIIHENSCLVMMKKWIILEWEIFMELEIHFELIHASIYCIHRRELNKNEYDLIRTSRKIHYKKHTKAWCSKFPSKNWNTSTFSYADHHNICTSMSNL